jgi:hypothetical protein
VSNIKLDILMGGNMNFLQLVHGLGGSLCIIPVHGEGSIKTRGTT